MSDVITATISAQPGPQTGFLSTPADICIYGGAAGGGKTVGLILEPLRHVSRVANFTAVFFRRTTPQITNPGGCGMRAETSMPGSAAHRTSSTPTRPQRSAQLIRATRCIAGGLYDAAMMFGDLPGARL